ncbi:hypothetical protein LBMAG42_23040 [Deltaproteobacteria bacterium]|nr:hypothetical protein LBMAG42_23040 [Deltaproteobacteria bacterium]
MSSHTESHGAHSPNEAPHATHEDAHYIKIWAILVALLVVSVTGPMLEIRVVTLLTAFGIAVVKAFLVAKHFMHLDTEKKFVVQLLVVCLGLVFLFFMATSPDIMKHFGMNWVNESAKNANIPEKIVHHGGVEGAAEHAEGAAEHAEGAAAPAEGAPAHPAGEAH